MWGKVKLTPILRAQGFAVSAARVGRILSVLMARGVAPRVPDLIRKAPPAGPQDNARTPSASPPE